MGQRTTALHLNGQGNRVPPAHALSAEQAVNLRGLGGPQYADQAQHQNHHQQDGRHEKNGASRGQRREQQRPQGYRQDGQMALHSFSGTATFCKMFINTCSAVMPFIRASGLGSRRWESTGSTMCCTSSGKMKSRPSSSAHAWAP